MTSAVIPAHNEQDFIVETVESLRSAAIVDEIIVVDDGSTDETGARAAKTGAKLIRLKRRRGKRGALDAGVRAARGSTLLFLDADLRETAANAGPLLEPVLRGEADMTIGVFPDRPGRGGGMGLVVGLARRGIEVITGQTMRAPLSGQRALRRIIWNNARGMAPGFGTEVALTIDAMVCGFRVLEVPVDMDHRVTGRDWPSMRHRARQFVDVARALWIRRKWRCRRSATPSRSD